MSLVNIVGFASMSNEATPQSETIQSLEDVSVANIDEEKDWGFEAGQSCSVRRSETRNDAVNRPKIIKIERLCLFSSGAVFLCYDSVMWQGEM